MICFAWGTLAKPILLVFDDDWEDLVGGPVWGAGEGFFLFGGAGRRAAKLLLLVDDDSWEGCGCGTALWGNGDGFFLGGGGEGALSFGGAGLDPNDWENVVLACWDGSCVLADETGGCDLLSDELYEGNVVLNFMPGGK